MQYMNRDFVKESISRVCRGAWDGSDKSKLCYRSSNDELYFEGNVIETGYEVFTAAPSVYENGELLYRRDAACVGPYHNEAYTEGRFDSEEAVCDYLTEKYANRVFDRVSSSDARKQPFRGNRVWEDAGYALQCKRQTLQRVAFRDLGMEGDKHKIMFVTACDEKDITKDGFCNDAHLVKGKKQPDGHNDHCVRLPDRMYHRLMNKANRDTQNTNNFTGVIICPVTREVSPDGRYSYNKIDLSFYAAMNDLLVRPEHGFNEYAHDDYITSSRILTRSYRNERAREKCITLDGTDYFDMDIDDPTL